MSSSTDDITTTTTTIPSSSLIQSISSSSLVLLSYVDTHCHLDEIFIKLRVNTFDEYQSKYLTPPSTSSSSSYLQKPGGFLLLNQPQFEGCIAQFCDPAAYSPSFATYPQLLSYPHIYGCFGIHPYSSKYYDDVLESRLIQALEHPKCVGVGECGLDYHIHPSSHRNGSAASNTTQSSSDSMMLSSREKQLVAFRRQIELSFVYKKPIVMHIRNAEADLLMILEEYYNNEEHRGDKIHMHCYGGSIEHTEILLRLYPGIKFGFTGNITYSKGAKEIVQMIPLDRILLETDGPHMCPDQSNIFPEAELSLLGTTASTSAGASAAGYDDINLPAPPSAGDPNRLPKPAIPSSDTGRGRGRGRGHSRESSRESNRESYHGEGRGGRSSGGGRGSQGRDSGGSNRGRGGGNGNRKSVSHSGLIPIIAQAIATYKNISMREVLFQCRENTRLFYGI